MSYQEIGEKVKVLAAFKDGTVFPYVFSWNNRRYIVEKVNLSYQEREGASLNYYYSVTAKGLVAKLKYNNHSFIWTVEEIWME